MKEINQESKIYDFDSFTGVAHVKSNKLWPVSQGVVFLTKGSVVHFKNGQPHNENGPAISIKSETSDALHHFFFENGMVREKGHSLEIHGISYRVVVYLNQKLEKHNIQGPAMIRTDIGDLQKETYYYQYYIDGISVSEKDFVEHPQVIDYNKRKLKSKVSKLD